VRERKRERDKSQIMIMLGLRESKSDWSVRFRLLGQVKLGEGIKVRLRVIKVNPDNPNNSITLSP
jgi:hypothetical protein